MDRDFYYLLPDGINTAENMKEGCEKLSRQTGHYWDGRTFRNLVKKGVIKKLNRITHDIISNRDVSNNNSGPADRV